MLPEAGPAPHTYRLDTTLLASPPKTSNQVIAVALPTTSRALDTDRIAAVEDGNELVFIGGARWASPLPRLVQSAALSHLSAKPSIGAAVRPEDGVLADAELRLEILSFEHDLSRQMAMVELRATLVAPQRREVVGAARFFRELPARGDSKSDVVAALNDSSRAALADVSRWAAAEMAGLGPRS